MFFSKKLIDKKTFLEVIGEDKDMVLTVLELFREQSELCVKTMHTAIERSDALSFKRAAHDLKNVGRNIASERLVEAAEELEGLGDNGELGSAAEKLVQAEKMLGTAEKELQGICNSL